MATATKFAEQGQRLQFASKNGGAPQVDNAARTADVILITEGLGNLRDKNYYTADAVLTAARVFERKQFFVDHPSSIDEESRPERSVRDLAGWFSGCRVGTYEDPDTGEKLTACYATLNFAESEPGQLAMDQVKSALRFQQQNPGSKDVYCGISINAGGLSEPGSIEMGGQEIEVNVVHEIEDAFSADIVTKPARGGRFLSMTESEKGNVERIESLVGKALGALMRESLAVTSESPKDGEKEATVAKVVKAGSVKQDAPKVKLSLTESERERLKALKAKGEDKLSETEAKELKGLRKKITEAAAAKITEAEGGKGYAKASKVAQAAEAEDEQESEDEDEADSEQESEDEDEADAEGEEESEGGKGYAKAGSILGEALKKLESIMGSESEDEGEQEAEGGEDEQEAAGDEQGAPPVAKKKAPVEDPHQQDAPVDDQAAAGPEDASDPMSVLADIYKDLQALAELLGGDQGAGDGSDMGAGDGIDAMGAEDEAKGGPAMRYGCAACGETNEVLAPKGFRMVRQTESAKGGPKDKSALREAVKRLSTRLAKKEDRFVETNQKVKTLIQENASLKAKLAARSRADRAAKVLREAKVPADILSVKDLIEFEPGQWIAQVKMAKRVMANESLGGGATPKGGSFKGTTEGQGAKAAIQAFEAADQR